MYRSTTKRTRLCKDAAGYRPAGGHRFRALRFERLEVRHLLAAVSWTGLGDGQLWSDPNNWSAEAVPVAGDDVSINLPGNPTIVYSAAAGNTTVNSLNGSDSLSITGGSLTVTANSTVSGSFSMTGGTLTATGSGVSFLASGPTTIEWSKSLRNCWRNSFVPFRDELCGGPGRLVGFHDVAGQRCQQRPGPALGDERHRQHGL